MEKHGEYGSISSIIGRHFFQYYSNIFPKLFSIIFPLGMEEKWKSNGKSENLLIPHHAASRLEQQVTGFPMQERNSIPTLQYNYRVLHNNKHYILE